MQKNVPLGLRAHRRSRSVSPFSARDDMENLNHAGRMRLMRIRKHMCGSRQARGRGRGRGQTRRDRPSIRPAARPQYRPSRARGTRRGRSAGAVRWSSSIDNVSISALTDATGIQEHLISDAQTSMQTEVSRFILFIETYQSNLL